MKRLSHLLLCLLAVFALPATASANVGTGLMLLTALHLVAGNTVIGLGEGLLLGWLFGARKRWAVPVMILANYFSAWVGAILTGDAMSDLTVGVHGLNALPMNLNNAWRWFWALAAASYLLTLLLEWPFVAWCLRRQADWRRRSIRATLVTQSLSYAVLFGLYFLASGTSLYTGDVRVVAPGELSLPGAVTVYYISTADGAAHRRSLASARDGAGEGESLAALHSAYRADRLFLRPNEANPAHWDLRAALKAHQKAPWVNQTVRSDLAGEATVDRNTAYWLQEARQPDPKKQKQARDFLEKTEDGAWMNFGAVQRIGAAKESPWEGFTGFWAIAGLRVKNRETGEAFGLCYETPFAQWMVRNATHLPSGHILFQLGDDQICLLEIATRRVALLWRGRGPVAVVEAAGQP